jgi:LPS sulfotransferase NodH
MTLTQRAVSAIDSPLVQRVRQTTVGRDIRATSVAAFALRALRERYVMEESGRDAAWRRSAAQWRSTAMAPEVGSPFVILCQARTGSNLVQTELSRRWPEIRCLGEEFGPHVRRNHPGETTADVMERVFAPTDDHPVVGCRLFYGHVSPAEFRAILAVPGMRVVHLQRRNALRRYVSLQIAVNTQVWARGRRKPAQRIDERTVTIDVDQFIDTTLRAAEHKARLEDVIAHSEGGVDVLEVWYEDVSEHLDAQLRRIAAFLGQGEPMVEAPPYLTRQNPEPLHLLIRNYAEVRRALSVTPMRAYLDPEDAGRKRRQAPPRPSCSRTCWPTAEQELLLRASFEPPRQARDAYRRWRVAADPYDIDEGSRRLLPLVHRNLRRGGSDAAPEAFVRDAYVNTSGRNQMLLRTLEGVLETLHDADVPTLVLKGAALTILHYRDRGVRPMSDLDVLVPTELMERALEALEAEGWGDPEPFRHSVALRRGDDELDLHRHVFDPAIAKDLDAALWQASVEMAVGAQRTRALAPPDQLLHAFVHGLRYNPMPPLRWIVDAHVVITSSSDELDWDRLLQLADRYRLVAPASAALVYLDGLCPRLVPPATLAAAQALPVTRVERRAFEQATRSAHWLTALWREHRLSQPDLTMAGAAARFPEALRVEYELDHVWQVPARAVRGMQQRRRPNGGAP